MSEVKQTITILENVAILKQQCIDAIRENLSPKQTQST
jgi:hypothetical protein